MRIRKLVVIVGVAITATAMSAPQTFNISFEGASNSNASSAESDTVKSIGRGVGVDESEALKDAYRDAIERAIGLYVDAETVVKNDEIVKDQILTLSNAYITHYDKLKTTNISGGLVEVRIVATVKKRALIAKVSEAMPAVNFSLGSRMQDLHANITTKEKRNADAATLLRNVLKDIDPIRQLMKPKICVETQKIINSKEYGHKSDSDMVGVRYIFKIELDREKYFKEMVPKLKSILEQITIEKSKEIRLSAIPFNDIFNSRERDRKLFLDGNGEEGPGRVYLSNSREDISRYAFFDSINLFGGLIKNHRLFFCSNYGEYSGNVSGYSKVSLELLDSGKLRDFRRDGWRGKNGRYHVVLVKEMNERMSSGKANLYSLDKASSDVLAEWMASCGGESDAWIYNIVFLDDQGKEILSAPWPISGLALMNVSVGEAVGYIGDSMMIQGEKASGIIYISPFIRCAGDGLMQWLDFKFHKDDLPKIKQVRIEIAE